MTIDTRLLKFFIVIAKEENITKAAQQLHITQPTLSRQIKSLEDELGVKLFKREKHSVQLTGQGHLFLRRAQEILELQNIAEEELSDYQKQLTGQLSIGLAEVQSAKTIIDIAGAFHKMHPDIHFRFLFRGEKRALEQLESGELDFALLPGHISLQRYGFVRLHQEEEWGLLIRKDSPLAARDFIQPEELDSMSITMIDNKKIVHMFEELSGYSSSHRNLNIALSYNSQYTAALMAQTGLVNALCVRLDCHYDNLVFVPLRPKVPMRTVFIWNQKSQVSDISLKFIEYLRENL